ncbi:extracellular solute-binding protein family 1 [Beutenbergia cavernae DSM 12333]|uniref:Extracellular solute-binding protein family 1 n=1 Tax=Beutenbergia cavernae (strain ATCC BAA-8 / DSM 12333 / CCUG 43141 / JCM 11478 / NBRC 16432 / NCIMB 13614 / HKI 0122) TaxID=471853 RepID=C5C451_BEUC1|nr:extracellular solute-binding protein [Beutenbergia cavernae]ACQ79964.1 extracellular solute-binding protein family 1 [Beutenbergia cavernae DSM 12333]
MRTTRRRALSLTAAALGVAMVATACGSGTPGEEAPEEGANGESGGGVVELEMWQTKFQDQEDEWYKTAVDEFNASQDEIHINLTTVPGDAWEQKVTAAQAAGRMPDIYTMNYANVLPAAARGELTPIGDLLGDDAFADMEEAVLGSVTNGDDQVFAYPMLVEPSAMLYYRASMFEAAGLDPDDPPTTFDELIEYGQALRDANPDVTAYGTSQVAADMGWSTWGLQMNTAGHFPISDDWSEGMATAPEYRPLFEMYQTLYAENILPRQALAGYADITPFGQGQLQMVACGSWGTSLLLNDYPDIVDDVRVAPMPSWDGDQTRPTATLGGWTWVVDAKSEHAQEAADAVAAILGNEDPSTLVDYFTTMQFSKVSPRSTVVDAINADPESATVNPWGQVISDVVPYSVPEPSYPWDISLAFATALEESLQGGDIDAAQQKAQDTIDAFIADNQLAGTAPGQ